MKFLLISMFIAITASSTAALAGTAPIRTDLTPKDIRARCSSFGDEITKIDGSCLNPTNGSALVCYGASCTELAPDPRYAKLKRLLEETSKDTRIE